MRESRSDEVVYEHDSCGSFERYCQCYVQLRYQETNVIFKVSSAKDIYFCAYRLAEFKLSQNLFRKLRTRILVKSINLSSRYRLNSKDE